MSALSSNIRRLSPISSGEMRGESIGYGGQAAGMVIAIYQSRPGMVPANGGSQMRHPLLLHAEALEEEAKAIRASVRAEAREAEALLPKGDYSAYDWKCVPALGWKQEDIGGFVLIGTLREGIAEADKAHTERYGQSRVNPPEPRKRSVRYYRNDYGILCHDHGGWLVLEDGRPMPDVDYAAARAGIVPTAYFK